MNKSVENSLPPNSEVDLGQQECSISNPAPVCPLKCNTYWGLLLSLVSALASTVGGLIVRHLTNFHPYSLAIYRFQGILISTLASILYFSLVKKKNVFNSVFPLKERNNTVIIGITTLRAVCGCLGLYLYFYAIKLMPLADAKVILSCRSVFVTFAAYLFLKEPFSFFSTFSALLSVVGIGVTAKTPMLFKGDGALNESTMMGTLLATLSMLTTVMSLIILRYLKKVHVTVVTLVFGIWGTILSSGCSAAVNRFDVPASGQEGILLLCLAFSAFLSQTTITLAMKYENAGVVVLVGTCDTIMSFVLQYFILGDAPDVYSLAGAALIAICISSITFQKWVNSQPKEHSVHKHFWFVLK